MMDIRQEFKDELKSLKYGHDKGLLDDFEKGYKNAMEKYEYLLINTK